MSHAHNLLIDDTPRRASNLSSKDTRNMVGLVKYLSTQQVTLGIDLPPLLQDILCHGFLFRALLCILHIM